MHTQDLNINAQLDQAEADTTLAHEKRRESEQQLLRVQEELNEVIMMSILNFW